MRYIIYKLVSSNGYTYVGSTSRKLSTRLAEHKCHAKNMIGPYKLFQNKSNVIIVKLEICTASDRFNREKYWMEKTKNTVNVCTPWQGPKDFKLYDHQIKLLSKKMKQRWLTNRAQVLNQINAHKTKAFQKSASAAGHMAKYKKMPLKKVICNSTAKVLGEFKTHNELAKILGIKSRKTIGRMLNGKGIFAGKYSIEVTP